ncbi:hypothetical protein Tco_1353523 [Tanacetum coccineum]
MDEFDAWMDGFGTNDDEVPTEEVSQDLWEEISEEIDEAHLKKVVDDMLRQGCNSGEEHQRKPVVHSCQRDSKAPPMTLQPRPVLLEVCVEHWKNIWVKQFHIKRQKEQRENPKRLYSDSKIVEVIRTSYELGHEHKFITKIIVRRANGKIDPIIEPDYKYLNKNDIEDFYCVIWERVHDFQLGMESYQQKVNLTASIITFPGIEEYEQFTITPEPVIGMIYANNKMEKKVTIHKEIHKFCDATLKRVLEMLKKYNKDVKYGYVDPSPSDADPEYLQIYEEDIEEQLKHHDQMRRWEMNVNERPLGSRRDQPESSTLRGRLIGLKKCRL